jgi:TonB family protein
VNPGAAAPVPRPSDAAAAAPSLGDSLRNLDQIIKRERFDNPTGGPNADDPAISFDSKGIDFGPWLTRFVAQVKRNWLIPYAAMTMRGRVVLTFNVHRNGRISDLKVVQGSDITAFNTAAFQALVLSNPTLALPAGYPDDVCEFKVTFFYNERPR